MKLRVLLWKTIRIFVIAYAVSIALLFFLQPHLLFHPSPPIGPPMEYGLKDFELISLTTKDNFKLKAWFHKGPQNHKALIYYYGNADSLIAYPSFFHKFAEHGYTVLAINYRGYGGSEGSPSETGLYEDGRTAVNYLKQSMSEKDIIVVGRSLGTGVAVQMAKEFDLNSVVLISPYTSIPDVAAKIYFWLPVHLASRYEFNSLEKISQINEPLLIIHGDADRLISVNNGKTLFAAVKARKAINIYKDGDHTSLDKNRIADDIFQFVDGPDAGK